MSRSSTAKPLGVNIAPNVSLSPTANRTVINGEMPAHGRWMLQHLIQYGKTLPGPVTMLAPGEPFPKKPTGTVISAIPNVPDDLSPIPSGPNKGTWAQDPLSGASEPSRPFGNLRVRSIDGIYSILLT